jgi:hypothetical protein
MDIKGMAVTDRRLQAFVTYKAAKLNALASIEANTLGDLKDTRSTVFKYAPPVFVRNAIGVFGSLLSHNLDTNARNIFCSHNIAERVDIMKFTDATLYDIRQQVINLLKWSVYDAVRV